MSNLILKFKSLSSCLSGLTAVGLMVAAAPVSHAQPYETTLGTANYIQNFDGLGQNSLAELPDGWVFAQGVGLPVYGNPLDCKSPPHRFTTNAVPLNCRTCTRSYDGQNGGPTPTGGGRVNWGDEVNHDPGWLDDRSIGFMSVNSTVVGSTTDYRTPTNYIMFGFVNNLGTNIISLDITNNIKVYRLTTIAATVEFFYSYDGSDWIPVSAGGSGPYPTAESNTAATNYLFTTGPWVTNASFTLSGLNIPHNTPFYLCWRLVIANSFGSFSVGLGLDDVEITATTGAPPVILTSVWPGGSGNWSTPGNWLGSTLPASSNRIVFAGPGGNVNHDLAALATGSGFVRSLAFSNTASASYVLSGNAMSLLGGVTNDSTFNQTINNNLTLNDDTTVRAVGGVLTLGGGITNSGFALTFDTSPNSVINGVISGGGSLIKTGPGVLTLNGAGAHTGGTVVSAGTLRLGGDERLVNAVPVTVAGTLDLNNFDETIASLAGGGNVNLGSGTLTVGVGDASGSFSGAMTGSGGLTKVGAGTQTITGTGNTYAGDTTITDGVLSLPNVGTLGTGAINLAGGTLSLTTTRDLTNGILPNAFTLTADSIVANSTGAGSGTRNLPFAGPVNAVAGTLTIKNITTGNFTNVMNLRFHNAGFTWPRPIVLDNSLAASQEYNTCQVDFSSSNGTPAQIITGVISGPGRVRRSALIPTDAGTTILSGANTHTLGTILNRGNLGLGINSASSGGVITSGPVGTGLLEWTADSGLFAHGGPRTIENYVFLNGVRDGLITGTNHLTLSGPMNLGTVAKGFTVDNTGTTTFAGSLTNTASLFKGGPGVLVLTAANENTGGWSITNGTLRVNNTTGSGTGSGDVTVMGAGVLGGTGTISGAVSGDGSVAPGTSAGILTLGGGLNLSAGGTLVWELAANSTAGPGANYDVLALTGGDLVLGGASKVAIQFTGSATAPDANNAFWQSPRSWTIVTLSGSAVNPGATKFAGILNGSYAAGSFTNYADVNGNIVLAFVPGATVTQPQFNTIAKLNDGNFRLNFSGSSGDGYSVRASTNVALPVVQWSVLGTGTFGAGPVVFDDLGATNFSRRFYLISVP